MKCLVVVSLLLLADVLWATPVPTQFKEEPLVDVPQDVAVNDPKHRWAFIPDSEGRMHLIDINPYETPVDPAFVPATDVVFMLFTRQNPTVAHRITFDLETLRSSHFNPSHPTRFTVHGWNGAPSNPVNTLSNQEYFRRGDYNMITVDWSVGASTINYITARNRVGPTGEFIATYIDFLFTNGYIQFQNLHVIGHSLGGHIVGHIGKAVTLGRIQVVYALDPAGPLFSLDDPLNRVAPTDGVYVEIMHTNGGLLGFRQPIGQASFFPNFGRSQPGCGTDVGGGCAHGRCAFLYAESINSQFTSHECTSFEEIDNDTCTRTGRTAFMAGPVGNIGLTGNYYLTTHGESPFSMG